MLVPFVDTVRYTAAQCCIIATAKHSETNVSTILLAHLLLQIKTLLQQQILHTYQGLCDMLADLPFA